jgi:hypothetical protein
MPLLCGVLKNNGKQVGVAVVSKIIKAAGYKWRKAKVVLTSSDPAYREKLDHIRTILSNLKSDEAFFSIDEYGPFAIKTKPGGRGQAHSREHREATGVPTLDILFVRSIMRTGLELGRRHGRRGLAAEPWPWKV